MRCKYCGSSVEENDSFCQVCGRSLSADADPVQPEASIQTEVLGTQPAVSRNEVEEAVKNSKNSLAVTSLILGILSIFCCGLFTAPAGIILSAFGLSSNKKGMAIAGMILSIVSIVIGVVYFVACMVFAASSGYYDAIFEAYGY